MAGNARDFSDDPANCTRGPFTTSSTANEPDTIIPPRGSKWMSPISTTTALSIQRDAIDDLSLSGTLAAGKNGPLVADTPNVFPCSGPFALASAGTGVTYSIHFSSTQP